MLKYDKYINYEETLSSPLIEGEKVLWSAKPKKSAFIINNVLALLPFALLWLIFDSMFIVAFSSGNAGQMKEILLFIIPFFAIHLMPVWIWLGNCLTANKKWKNTKYYLTDKRIIIQTGIIGANYETIHYKEIKKVNLKIGLIDKMLGVGDIYIDTGLVSSNNNGTRSVMFDIENPYEIYPKLQKIVLDIQTDVEFPNAYRPSENPGYNTEYRG